MSDSRDFLFEDGELQRTADALARSVPPIPEADPAFRSQLRRQLMHEAWDRKQPRVRLWRRLLTPAPMAWAGAVVGVALIAVATFGFLSPTRDSTQQYGTWNVSGAGQVAPDQVLTLSFAEQVDHPAVEAAIRIEPATTVTYSWSGNTVTIVPTSGFAPNTQYEVAMAPVKTSGGSVVQAKPVSFTASAPVAVVPTPSPSSSPPPAPIAVRQGPASGSVRPAWLDATRLVLVGPDGSARVHAPATGDGFALSADTGVRALNARSDGSAVALLNDAGVIQTAVPATAPATVTPAGKPVAGSAGALTAVYDPAGRLLFATATSVGGGTGVARQFSAPATAAWFAPTADRLLFQAATGLRSMDLATGAESAWPAGQVTFLAYSPDGRRVAYSGAGGVFAASAADGSGPVKLAPNTGVTAGDWSAQDELLFSGGGSAWSVRGDGSGLRKLDDGDFGTPQWRPTADAFAFLRGGSLFVAQVTPRPAAPAGSDLGTTEAAAVLDQFLQARVSGRADVAQSFLDATGREAYGGGPGLASLEPSGLARYFVVARQSAGGKVAFAVRLVLDDHPGGRDVGQLDEFIGVVRDTSGRPVVHSVSVSPVRPYGKGPEVVAVSLSPVPSGSLVLEFDSSLRAETAATITVLDANNRPLPVKAEVHDRTVTLTLPPAGPLPAKMVVPATVLDKDGLASAGYSLELLTAQG